MKKRRICSVFLLPILAIACVAIISQAVFAQSSNPITGGRVILSKQSTSSDSDSDSGSGNWDLRFMATSGSNTFNTEDEYQGAVYYGFDAYMDSENDACRVAARIEDQYEVQTDQVNPSSDGDSVIAHKHVDLQHEDALLAPSSDNSVIFCLWDISKCGCQQYGGPGILVGASRLKIDSDTKLTGTIDQFPE